MYSQPVAASNGDKQQYDKRQYVTDLDRDFGARVRATRERQGVSQQHVALVLEAMYGIPWHQTTVAKTESGERPIRLAEAVAVAQALSVPLDELLHDADEGRKRERIEAAFGELMKVRDHVDARMKRMGEEFRGGEHPEAT